MNNIIENGIKHASEDYRVSICIDESHRDVLSSLDVPISVTVDVKNTVSGLFVEISGDARRVIETEVALFELLRPIRHNCAGSKEYEIAD